MGGWVAVGGGEGTGEGGRQALRLRPTGVSVNRSLKIKGSTKFPTATCIAPGTRMIAIDCRAEYTASRRGTAVTQQWRGRDDIGTNAAAHLGQREILENQDRDRQQRRYQWTDVRYAIQNDPAAQGAKCGSWHGKWGSCVRHGLGCARQRLMFDERG